MKKDSEWTFIDLKRAAAECDGSLPCCKAAILGDSATQHLAVAVRGYLFRKGVPTAVYEAEYDSVMQETIDAGSGLYRFCPDFILLYLCTEKLYQKFCKTPEERRARFAEEAFGEIAGYWNAIFAHTRAKIVQYNFIERDDGVFGSYALKTETSFLSQLKKLNRLLEEGCRAQKDVYVCDLNGLAAYYGYRNFHSEALYDVATMPIYTEFVPQAAKRAGDIILALRGKGKKCVVLDLDNTLWGGVVGDDGLEGIQLGELGAGRAFVRFQRWLKELSSRGIILCVCSKNEEKAAKQPFEEHPDMVLRLSDIAVFVANWEDKAQNIRHILRQLNIGADSVVFLDDNPFERDFVRAAVPDVTVPDLPQDPSEYVRYLQELNLFETASLSAEDRRRNTQYREEAARAESAQRYTTLDEFLADLHMTVDCSPFRPFQYPRIAQLSQRSNQFNLRTVRYTEAEIAQIASDKNYLTLQFSMQDRFGDCGLVSVVILKKEEDALFVDTWLMSCRVLKRTLEEFVVNTIVRIARAHGFRRIVGEYLPTAKNKMVEKIYPAFGFAAAGENRFVLEADRYIPKKTFIAECANDHKTQ